jgi:hypothetical protein
MRKLHPDGPLWTFWDYKSERWKKDKGVRLDHFLLSPNLSVRLVDGGVDRWARVGRKTRATMPQHGSGSISRPESRFQPAFLSGPPSNVKSCLSPPAYAFVSIRIRNLTQCTRKQIFPRRC